MTQSRRLATATVMVAALLVLSARSVAGHCDGIDGPVVKAAQAALRTGDINGVLIWIQEKDETEIRDSFQRALAVRALGGDAQKLADWYFFETLVRVHRAGEGAPYTGLKPAGRDLGPAIPAADNAIESGSVEPLVNLIVAAAERELRERFAHVVHTKGAAAGDVRAGRNHVQAYVEFVHYVEQLYEATQSEAHGHAPEKTVR